MMMSQDLEELNKPPADDAYSIFVRENQWNLSLNKTVFKACILWYDFEELYRDME